MTDTLTNTLANPGEFDAMSKLREGEVYFLLLGRDRIAPGLVDEWADRNRRKAMAEYADGKISRNELERELRQSTQAEVIASDMRAYKAGWEADAAAGQRPLPYTGIVLPEEQRQRDDLAAARNKAASSINATVSLLRVVVETLEPFVAKAEDAKLCDLDNVVREEIESLKALAEVVVSWRPIGARSAS